MKAFFRQNGKAIAGGALGMVLVLALVGSWLAVSDYLFRRGEHDTMKNIVIDLQKRMPVVEKAAGLK